MLPVALHRLERNTRVTSSETTHAHATREDEGVPTRSKVALAMAALACTACCALPFLIVAGVLTGAGAALLKQTLIAVAIGLVVLALGMWWLRRRQLAKRAAAGSAGCDDENCAC